MRILHLTLNKLPFDTFEAGLKDREYRKPSKWIKSRLIDSKTGKNKNYDLVLLKNGYSKKSRYLVFKFIGFEKSKINYRVDYKTGLSVQVRKGDYRILLGNITTKGNIDSLDLF
jgi:hypothetical protein